MAEQASPRFVRLEVVALFVGGPADGQLMALPGDQYGRPRELTVRLPACPGPPSLWDCVPDLDEPVVPPVALYEADLAVSDGDHVWRFRYRGQR